jgi:hypothetical protein
MAALLQEVKVRVPMAIAAKHPKVARLSFMTSVFCRFWFYDGVRAMGFNAVPKDFAKVLIFIELKFQFKKGRLQRSKQRPSFENNCIFATFEKILI